MLPQFPERLRYIVHHKAVMLGEELHPHLGNLPTGEVKMDAVEERHVLTDHLRHGKEEV